MFQTSSGNLLRTIAKGENKGSVERIAVVFSLEGVEETAEEAVSTATQILEVFAEDRTLIESLSRFAGNALRVHSLLQRKPVVSVSAANDLNLSAPMVKSAIDNLQNIGLVSEATGKKTRLSFCLQSLSRHPSGRHGRNVSELLNLRRKLRMQNDFALLPCVRITEISTKFGND